MGLPQYTRNILLLTEVPTYVHTYARTDGLAGAKGGRTRERKEQSTERPCHEEPPETLRVDDMPTGDGPEAGAAWLLIRAKTHK